MAKSNVIELAGRDTIVDPLTDLLRAGAEKLIYQAVEVELQELLTQHSPPAIYRMLGDGPNRDQVVSRKSR